MGTGSDADASGCGGVAAGNKANGVGGVRGIDADGVTTKLKDILDKGLS